MAFSDGSRENGMEGSQDFDRNRRYGISFDFDNEQEYILAGPEIKFDGDIE
jgi:hypothetical protein